MRGAANPPLLGVGDIHVSSSQSALFADAALVCTEWPIFRELDWEKAGHQMSRRLVIDGRNLYNAKKMQALGFDYYSFGRS